MKILLSSICALAVIAGANGAFAADPNDGQNPVSAASRAKAARAATTLIYRISGVEGSGVNYAGSGTIILCTNPTSNPVDVSTQIFKIDGTASGGLMARTFAAKQTSTFGTQFHNIYSENDVTHVSVSTGYALVKTSDTKVFCTALLLDSSASVPAGVPLHMVRYHPLSGTQE
jgi:hypothetical protein